MQISFAYFVKVCYTILTSEIEDNINVKGACTMDEQNILNIKKEANNVREAAQSMSEKTQGIYQMLEVLIDRTKKINEVTKAIQAIANKTNMLSLNASIESARAGEYGRGFSVVAKQMQELANTTKDSSAEVFVLLKELSAETANIEDQLNSLVEDVNRQNEYSDNLVASIDELE